MGTTKKSSIPQVYQIVAPVPDVGSDFYITLQVAHFKESGNTNRADMIYMGDSRELFIDNYFNYCLTWFLAGLLVLLGFYHIVIFSRNKKEKTSLYFGICCALLVVFIFCIKSLLIPIFYGYTVYYLTFHILYIAMFLLFPFLATFLTTLLKVVIHKYLLIFFYLLETSGYCGR